MIRRRLLAVLSGLMLVALVAAPASADDELAIESVDTSGLPIVSITVTLPASMAGTIPDADDFAVLVDGRRPRVDVYAEVQEPLEVVLVVDTSGSMEGAPIDQAREAAKAFVGAMPPDASVTVVAFGNGADVVATPEDDASAAIEALQAAGETALYDAILLASNAFAPGVDTRRVMVVLSDGGDTASQATLADAIDAASASGADVQAIALETEDTDLAALGGIAPGAVSTAEHAAELVGLYSDLAIRLTGSYRLEFEANRAEGPTEVQIAVDTGAGVVSSQVTIEFPTSASPSSSARPGDEATAGAVVPEAAPAIVDVDALARSWTLPAGVALVFVGVLFMLWLTLRGREENPVPVIEEVKPKGRFGFISNLAKRAGSIGDRIAESRETGEPAGSLDAALDRAGLNLRPGEFIVVAATGIIVATLTGLTIGGGFGALAFGALAAAAPRTVLKTLAERRRRAFAEQLEGTLQIIAGSLRAGYGLTQAVQTVAEESESPTSVEFNRVVVENRLGRTIEQSLHAMSSRMQNEDLEWVVEAIEIQHEVGGDLAEVLDTVTTTIRDRNQIRRQVKALSAEGRISAIILLALPFVIAGFISMISPDYLAELTGTAVGNLMLVVAALLMLAGGAWIKKIIKVDF